jgi:hypothetical protein
VSGSFFTDRGAWSVVDFDRRPIQRLQIKSQNMPDGGCKAVISNPFERSLSADEVNDLIQQANAVWNPPNVQWTHPFIPDISCEVDLFDGPDVFIDTGSICPPETGQLVEAIDLIDIPRRDAATHLTTKHLLPTK